MKSLYLIVLLALVFGISKASAQTIVVKADQPDREYEEKLKGESQYIKLESGEGYNLSYELENKYISILAVTDEPNKYDISDVYKNAKNKKESTVKKFALSKIGASDSSFFTIQFAVPKADDLSKLPFPTFSQNSDSEFESYKRNRHLIINANPNPKARLNTQLFKYKKEKVNISEDSDEEDKADKDDENEDKVVKEILGKANAIPKNGSITVFIKNYNFWQVEEISISMNEQDYTYNKGLIDVRNQVLPDDEDSSGLDDEEQTTGEEGFVPGADSNDKGTPQDPFEAYLANVFNNWEGIDYLNFNDLAQVESYKDTLIKSVNKNKIALTRDQQKLYNQILSWYPDYVSLTDIPLSSVDADEVEFKLKIKNENESTETEYDLRTYRIVGGLSFNISSTLFLTGLVERIRLRAEACRIVQTSVT